MPSFMVIIYLCVDVVLRRFILITGHVPSVNVPVVEGVAMHEYPVRGLAFNSLDEY
jgi:hypothetical protein